MEGKVNGQCAILMEDISLAEALLDGVMAARTWVEGYDLTLADEGVYEALVLLSPAHVVGGVLGARSRLGYFEAASDVARWVVRIDDGEARGEGRGE